MYKIPLSYTAPDREKLSRVLQQYEGIHHNKIIKDFEGALTRITGATYAVALNSGTAAIHLGLMLLDVKSGDEVLVSTFTYIASVNPIVYLGARPVFIDSEPETWNMDPDILEQAINDRLKSGVKPKAIVIVHVYGMPAKIVEVRSIANKYGIPLLEDAAEALGSTLNSQHVGTFGEIGVLSFNNNKIITTYGGGALITNNESFYKKAAFLAEQARENERFYEHHQIGYNYRMGALNAAMGLAQINDFATILNSRRSVYEAYRVGLEGLGIKFLREIKGSQSNRWLTTVVLNADQPALKIMELLGREGIEVRLLWKSMHNQAVFKEFQYFGSNFAEKMFETGLCLPSGHVLQPEDQYLIIQKIKNLL